MRPYKFHGIELDLDNTIHIDVKDNILILEIEEKRERIQVAYTSEDALVEDIYRLKKAFYETEKKTGNCCMLI